MDGTEQIVKNREVSILLTCEVSDCLPIGSMIAGPSASKMHFHFRPLFCGFFCQNIFTIYIKIYICLYAIWWSLSTAGGTTFAPLELGHSTDDGAGTPPIEGRGKIQVAFYRKNDSSVWFRAPTAVPGLSLLPGAPLTGAPAPGRPTLPVREGAPVHAVVLLRATGLCRALSDGAYIWVTALGGSLSPLTGLLLLRFSVDLPEGVNASWGSRII